MHFSDSSNPEQALTFSEGEKARIRAVLAGALGLSARDQDDFIAAVEKTGVLPAFGCGSLLSYSHMEVSAPEGGKRFWKQSLLEKFPGLNTDALYRVVPASLPGYINDFVCRDTFYRGTPENPGLTIGIDECEGRATNGGILQTDMTALGLHREQVVDFVEYYLQEFASREFPPNMPIYKFALKIMDLPGGTTAPGLACIADREGPLYAGHLDLAERAQILATARGPVTDPKTGQQKPKGAINNLDYMRNTFDGMVANGVPVPRRFVDLYTLAVAIRQDLPADRLSALQQFERAGRHDEVVEFLDEARIPVTWNLAPGASHMLCLGRN